MDARQAPSPRGGRPPGPSKPTSAQAPVASSSSTSHTDRTQSPSMVQPQVQTAPASKVAKTSTATTSRTSSRLAENEKPTRNASKDSLKLKLKSSIRASTTPEPNKHEQLCKAASQNISDLRGLVTCKICIKLLYEPYIISCGHTYCYSCLCQWFVGQKSKTCPDCRTKVTQAPAPAYLIREMANLFISRAELLPAGETREQHEKDQKEEADIVQRDKNNTDARTGGLFRGCFKARPIETIRPIHDEEDGVERCPMCAWEMEDMQCTRCGFQYNDGALPWDGSFDGFSDMDETSEQGLSSEEIDADIDMEDHDGEPGFDDYGGGAYDGWDDEYYEDDQPYAVRRWLANGGALQATRLEYGLPPRRAAAHSAAGSRRRSYTASLISHTEDTEMGTLQEEDEEDMDEGSLMNSFINDDGSEEASTPDQTPVPPSNSQSQRRNRRVVESESASSVSHTTEEDDDEEGPVPNGRRRQLARASVQPSRTRRRLVAPSSSTDETSTANDLDEDTQALLEEGGWAQLGNDDEMDDDEYESDGGRTTVGWGPIAISNARSRIAGSLTPTADRPNVPIRPPSRTGNTRFPDGSRGLRRRSSVLSNATTVPYEDGEADDDDSDIDRDGDINMNAPRLRTRSSRMRIRDNIAPPTATSQFANRGLSLGESIDLDTDDNSDTSAHPTRRRQRPGPRNQQYDPRISYMFAQHWTDIRELQRPGTLFEQLEQLRGTPLARPRTSNRQRTPQPSSNPPFSPLSNGSLPPFSPLSPPANPINRMRTPSLDSTNSRGTPSVQSVPSQQSRAASGPSTSIENSNPNNGVSLNQTFPGLAANGNEGRGGSSAGLRAVPQTTPNVVQPPRFPTAPEDAIDRPLSRVAARPPSAAGRRGSGSYMSPIQGSFSPGLNYAARAAAQNRNPWNSYLFQAQYTMGRRPSTRQLREQSSTATLRPQNSTRHLRGQPSRTNIGDGLMQSPNMRQQASRMNLRQQPSQRRLQAQASSRTLRGSDPSYPLQPPTTAGGPVTAASPRAGRSDPPRMTQEERARRAADLISRRQQELGTSSNPFAARRHSNASNGSNSGGSASQAPTRPQGLARQDTVNPPSAGPAPPLGLTGAVQPPIPAPQTAGYPTLNRRRSNRSIGAHPPGVFLPMQDPSMNGFARPRVSPGPASPSYDPPFGSGRGIVSPIQY